MTQKITKHHRHQHQVLEQEHRLARQQRVELGVGAQHGRAATRPGRSSRRPSRRSAARTGRRASRRRTRGSSPGCRERTRNVPMIASVAGGQDSDTFHTFSIPRFSWIITEWMNAVHGQPRHQRGVLDRVPGPVAAPAELGVGPARAEQDPDPQEQPGRQREPPRHRDPFGAQPPGDAARRSRTRTGSSAACTPSTASAGGSSSLGCSSSGSRPAPSAGGLAWSRTGWRRTPSATMKNAAEAEQHRGRVRRDLAHPAAGQEQDQARPQRQQPHPQQQRALLRGPRRRQLVERRRGASRSVRRRR